jgi:hypothetical protein
MSKEVKDYLFLYLGCEVMAFHPYADEPGPSKAYLTGITGMDEYNVELQFHNGVHAEEEPCYIKYEEVEPILRPLSDMTNTEAIEMWDIINPHRLHFDVSVKVNYYKRKTSCFSAEEVRILLSKHFDLFGLIEAGLAIDSTTIKKSST